MSRIVAARFENAVEAEGAVAALAREGFNAPEIESFYVSPPGQHAAHPMGGDSHSDAGARRGGWGAVLGALIGAVAGLALGTAFSSNLGLAAILLGAGLGAYVGSFIGAMLQMRAARQSESTREHPVEPAAGMMVAVNVDRPQMEDRAVSVLRRQGARSLGRAEGRWVDGSWRDFDPRTPIGVL